MTGDLWAGAEVQLYNTMCELVKQSHDNFPVVLFSNGELYRKLMSLNQNIYLLDEENLSSMNICFELSKLIRKERPSIIHVHDYKSHITAAIAKLIVKSDCKIIRTLHGLKIIPRTIKMLKSSALSFVEYILLRNYTSCIIAVSTDIKNILLNKYPNTKVQQINNAINIPAEYGISNREDVRKLFNIKNDEIWVGAASRLVKVKNIGLLIDAVSYIRKQSECKLKVSVFGEGPEKNSLLQKIKNLGLDDMITLHGHNNDIIPILNAFDIFVNCSQHEGLPMSIIEAMSVGTVPVCTRVGGMQEIIQDKRNGLLVDPDNAIELAKAILQLSDEKNMRESMGNNAITRVKQDYSIEKSVSSLLTLYGSL